MNEPKINTNGDNTKKKIDIFLFSSLIKKFLTG